MATPRTNKLADRMKRPAPTAQETARQPALSASFKEAPEEYPKRLTLDLTNEQHRKFKLYALTQGTTMNKILRDFIDDLP